MFEKGESTTECDILIEGEKVEQAKEFVCLGNLFTNDGKHDRDIETRVNEALLAIMNSKTLSRQARLAIHSGILISTLMYGGESWIWQKKSKGGSMQWRCDRFVVCVECLEKIDVKTVMLESGVV
ncbi:hypothetical protein EVAR_11011_1 [Eumeta japonica]|uniref:Uncharacterized protein n=1 Tax=Eumeta variegata TaxID=151549 RepID=A0A4C1YMP8_EUMVA|nr:hypothetical protein EVAR_11011_1 [Eumeta japonica]